MKLHSPSIKWYLAKNQTMLPSLLTSSAAQPQTPESRAITTVQEFHTPAMKNADRLEDIAARMSVDSQQTVFQTSSVSRVIRRDWNIVCAKMFVFGLKRDYRKKIEEDLNELHWQVADLAEVTDIGLFSEQDASWLSPVTVSLRIVCPQGASWLRAMHAWDNSDAKLITAVKAGLITKEKRFAMMAAVQMAYVGFKGTAMRKPLKTSSEMLEEAQLI